MGDVPVAGGIVGIQGDVSSYQDALQLKVERLVALDSTGDAWTEFVPASTRSAQDLRTELERVVASISDNGLRRLVTAIVLEGEIAARFATAPAAEKMHHAFARGLLEHTLSVVQLVELLAAQYPSLVDRDLLVAGALLHDVGKTSELRNGPVAGYTTEGQLLGHIVIGVTMIEAAAAQIPELSSEQRLLLNHLILSHHNLPEHGSPQRPALPEAMLLPLC